MDHRPRGLGRGLKLPSFELAASGVFELLQTVSSVNQLFEVCQDIVCFDSKEEMLDKINHYLVHDQERRGIAGERRQRVLRDHTWTSRIQRMLQPMQELLPADD